MFGEEVLVEKSDIFIEDEASMGIKSKCDIAGLRLKAEERAEVLLDENICLHCNIENAADWQIGKNAKVEIGKSGRFGSNGGIVCLYENAFLSIKKEFSVNGNYRFVLDPDTSIFIGEDCLFSWDISMRSNDGHSIFDIATRENIDSSPAISKERKIIIGNHVWVGDRATILYNTQIGDGSIIGALSLVKSKLPNNCIAAGIPARVIKKDVAWCRRYSAKDMMECGERNIRYTEEY